MAILRFTASRDASISNALMDFSPFSASYANSGLSDTLEIFTIYNADGFTTASSGNGISRICINFPVADLLANTTIPTATSQVFLKLFNIPHAETLPISATLSVYPLTRSWDEGRGLNLDPMVDLDAVNWMSRSIGNAWSSPGGDALFSTVFHQNFPNGTENMQLDISSLISTYRSGTIANNGFLIALSSTLEYATESFYTKRFSARGTEFFYNRPVLEVIWDDSINDDRNNSYTSASIASAADNTNTLYIYNRVRGQLKDLPYIGNGPIYVSFYTATTTGSTSISAWSTGSWFKTGIYSATFSSTYTGTLTDVWHNNAGVVYYTGSIEMKSFLDDYYDENDELIISMPNLKTSYNVNDNPHLDVFVRNRDWKGNIYTVATTTQQAEYIKKMYYRIVRTIDNKEIIPFGTGSIEYTKLSYDTDSNFFTFNMNILEPNYQYQFEYIIKVDDKPTIQKDKFKFRVES